MEVRRSDELAGVVRELYAAMGSGDAEAVEAFYNLRPHAVFLETDKAEFWTDSARHNQDVRPYGERAGNLVIPGELPAFACGDVGWTVDRPTIELATGERFQTRLTFVSTARRGRGGGARPHPGRAGTGGMRSTGLGLSYR